MEKLNVLIIHQRKNHNRCSEDDHHQPAWLTDWLFGGKEHTVDLWMKSKSTTISGRSQVQKKLCVGSSEEQVDNYFQTISGTELTLTDCFFGGQEQPVDNYFRTSSDKLKQCDRRSKDIIALVHQVPCSTRGYEWSLDHQKTSEKFKISTKGGRPHVSQLRNGSSKQSRHHGHWFVSMG